MRKHGAHPGSGGLPQGDARPGAQRIDEIVEQVLRRRARGEDVSDKELARQYPHIWPELSAALETALRVGQQLLAARKAGQRVDQIEPLPADELEAPLESPGDFAPIAPDPYSIEGYVIQREISRGGQATVLLAVQQATGRQVAIKVMAGGPFITSRSRGRFEREAEILAKLQHPGIVGILDKGRTADGSWFIVMDYIDGRNLDEHVDEARRKGTSQREVLGVFARVAEALEEAHRLSVVHRDLKPSNIRVDPWGQPHLLDFGLAHLQKPDEDGRVSYRLTVTGNVVGSLPWASPEQARGEMTQFTAASDIYSLGVVMYQALTGQAPYPPGETIPSTIQIICSTVPPALDRCKRPAFGPIAPALSCIVLKCLEKDYRRRYATAADLVADLRAFLDGRPISIPVPRPPNRWRTAALLTLALVLGGVAAVPWIARHDPAHVTHIELPRETNIIGMEMVLVPAGTFWMGSKLQEEGRDRREQHYSVRVRTPFWISRTEVTQEQYQRIMGRLPEGLDVIDGTLPVDHVSWTNVMLFCSRLSETDGRRYRLPTEVEWEYACRAGSERPFGHAASPLEVGWYNSNSKGRLHPVGLKKPNSWGLFDMHGNVAEWCMDEHRGFSEQFHADGRPIPTAHSFAVVRGGSAYARVSEARAAARDMGRISATRKGLGFRVVCEVQE